MDKADDRRSTKLNDVFKKQLFGRQLSSVFSFSFTPELIFGLYLLYYFRVFERQIGSNKYSGGRRAGPSLGWSDGLSYS
ncbi:hypothetical protein EJ110_NYTH08355 [Nymphaea thermarum]|nr:hypothetical protein EJ110_NYTH08355 [Nymphaea thermarum]